jgi:hypothetical protein
VITVVNIGTGTTSVTIGAGGVPAAAQIIVCTSDNGSVATGASVTDTAGNTYLIPNAIGLAHVAGLSVAAYRARTGLALVNGNTITYTPTTGATLSHISAFYVLGLDNVAGDTGAYFAATGTSTAPSVTSLTPVTGGEFFIGVVGGATLVVSFTQDSTNAAWASPPGQASLAATVLVGGNVVNPSKTTLTYAPTLGTSDTWIAVIYALFVAPTSGWEPQLPVVPSRSLSYRKTTAVLARGDDGIAATKINFVPFGHPMQNVDLPHRRTEKSGAIVTDDDGTEAAFINWKNSGWEVQSFQPPHFDPEKKAGGWLRGDEGIYGPFSVWFNQGWEQAPPWQPPHFRVEQHGPWIRGDDGITATFQVWQNAGTEVYEIKFQPPHPRPERSGSVQIGDPGTQAQFVQWRNSGWEVQPHQPPHPRPERAGAIQPIVNIDAVFSYFLPAGWEVQPPQPPHPRPERSGAILRGVDGTEAVFIPPPPSPTLAFEREWLPLRITYRAAAAAATMRGDDGVYGPLQRWFNAGWEVQPVQPPHPSPERKAASWLRADDGTQYPLLRWLNAGWDVQHPQPPHPRPERAAAITAPAPLGNIDATLVGFSPSGWEVQSVQPGHPRPERGAAFLRGDDGNYAIYVFVPPVPVIIPPAGGSSYLLRKIEEERRRKRRAKEARQPEPAEPLIEAPQEAPQETSPQHVEVPKKARTARPFREIVEPSHGSIPPQPRAPELKLPPVSQRQDEEEYLEFYRLNYEYETKMFNQLLAKLLAEFSKK